MTFRFRHSTTPQQPPCSGYLKIVTSVRTHKRYINISNTSLTYGHRPDNILWTADLTQCQIKPTANTISITRPCGKKVRLRLSKPEMQAWFPRIISASMGLESLYCVGGVLACIAGWPLLGGCDRDCGDDIRVWSVGKSDVGRRWCLAERDGNVLSLCARVDRAVRVMDLFEDCSNFHVVTNVFRGKELSACQDMDDDCWRGVVKDVLTVLSALHEVGLAHGAVPDAVVVDGSRAWVMVYGYAHIASTEEILSDGKDFAKILRKMCASGLGRVLDLLEKGVPVAEVLNEPCFWDGDELIDFCALEKRTKAEVDSPRSVLQSENVL